MGNCIPINFTLAFVKEDICVLVALIIYGSQMQLPGESFSDSACIVSIQVFAQEMKEHMQKFHSPFFHFPNTQVVRCLQRFNVRYSRFGEARFQFDVH